MTDQKIEKLSNEIKVELEDLHFKFKFSEIIRKGQDILMITIILSAEEGAMAEFSI
jgi:hypothetical protein